VVALRHPKHTPEHRLPVWLPAAQRPLGRNGASLIGRDTAKVSTEHCAVAFSTAFRWRHRFLGAVTRGAITLRGLAEADGTFFDQR